MTELRGRPDGATPTEGSSEAAEPGAPVLALRGISKSFFGVRVLSDVDLDCYGGEIHAICGENGAGKSTLMKTIVGAHAPDSGGTILLDGEPVSFAHPRQAQDHGIGIIYQEFNLLTDRTVAQNIFLGREPRKGPFIDQGRMHTRTQELLDDLHVGDTISPRTTIRDLSVAQQQMVEIAKALSLDARVLIMDEPTASLSPPEAAALFERMRMLRERGLVILYISHRLSEVFELAQRITVLKDGNKVGTVAVGDVTTGDLVRMMVGREITHYYPDRATADEVGEPWLAVRGGGVGMLADIDLDVRRGEVVGIAGLEGSGRTELAHAIFGVRPFTSGTMEIEGDKVAIRTPREAIRRGIGFLTEDRKGEGLVLVRSVEENALLPLRSLSGAVRKERGGAKDGSGLVARLLQRVELRGGRPGQEVRFLSGGNQQKVVLTKWLATEADFFIFDEPTRGIDVGAKAGIHELMRELAQAGKAVLMISSELPEVIGMSDRVLVMRQGRLAGELPPDPTEPQIMLLATGETDHEEDRVPGSTNPAGATRAPDGEVRP